MSGKFVVQKSGHIFSTIDIVQAHEQISKVKIYGGMIGLTRNQPALLWWTVAGPQMARIVQEFEGSLKPPTASTNILHHEQVPGIQKDFVRNVKSMVSTIQDMANPFTEDRHDLSEAVSNSLYNVKTIGQQQYDTFVDESLVVFSPICKSHSQE